jgi:glycosyltransferase involved in cell wall biosynthesis
MSPWRPTAVEACEGAETLSNSDTTLSHLAPSAHGVEVRARHAVSFVLPAFNEEHNIVKAVRGAVSVGERCCSEYEVVVVDDGSSDGTAELVRALASRHRGVRLVAHGANRGYGEALRSGFAAARLEYVFFTDADNQFDIEELPLLLAWADDAGVVAGYRKVRQDSKVRLLNAWLWNRLVRALFYVPVRDIDCAFKLFRRSALVDLEIESRGAMINTEIMVKLARGGWRIVEVGVTHLPRAAGNPQGAKPRVILRALGEVVRLYPRLTDAQPPSWTTAWR